MKKVLIGTKKPFIPEAIAQVKNIFSGKEYELILLQGYTEQEELIEAVSDVNAFLVRSDKITSEIIEAANNLEVIVRAGAGYDNIDLNACTEKGIVVMNTPGQNSNAVAELVFGMMIYQARNSFDGTAGNELKGEKLGIHAFGNVGKCIARIGKGFNMEIYAYDPFLKKDEIEKYGVKAIQDLKEMYKICKYISLNMPANDKTKNSIGYELLSLMPKGATLINTARKEVINEDELLKIFKEKPGFIYLADVAPDCKDKIEDNCQKRYLFTSKKMGAQTKQANVNAAKAAAIQIKNYFEKGDTTFKVNKLFK